MTRLNLVPPSELMDQHLFAEFREIKMVPKSLARSINARGINEVLKRIPEHFTLGTGHVSFFYNKGAYLSNRYLELRTELKRRGVNFNYSSKLDDCAVYALLPVAFMQTYEPTPDALALVRERIEQRLALRPGWYRYYGDVKE